jgi:hypothetical protein
MALRLATQLQDYVTQVLCLKLLILRSQDATRLFEQLGHLQKSVQEDRDEYLHTCLSNYLVCKAKTSQKRLLAELREFDDWTESWVLRAPHTYLAKQCIERALSSKINDRGSLPPLKTGNMQYYAWLSEYDRNFVHRIQGVDIHDSPRAAPSTRTWYDDTHELSESERQRRAAVPVSGSVPHKKQNDIRRPRTIDKLERAELEKAYNELVPHKKRKDKRRPRTIDKQESAVAEKDLDSSAYDELSSHSSSSEDSGDFRLTFSHGLSYKMGKELVADKRIAVTLKSQDMMTEEHTTVSWVKDGDFVSTIITEKHKYKEAEVSNPQRGRRSSKKSKSGKLTGAYQEPEHSANGAREARNGVARG